MNALQETRARLVGTLDALVLKRDTEVRTFEWQVLDPLTDTPQFEMKPGGPGKRAVQLRDALERVASCPRYMRRCNKVEFPSFLNRMCSIAVRYMGPDLSKIINNPKVLERFLEHLLAHFELLGGVDAPRGVLIRNAHKFSLFGINTIPDDAREAFGSCADTEKLERTAIVLVLARRYGSIQEAKESYLTALREAQEVCGSEPGAGEIQRSVAYEVFIKRASSVHEALNRVRSRTEKTRLEVAGSGKAVI